MSEAQVQLAHGSARRIGRARPGDEGYVAPANLTYVTLWHKGCALTPVWVGYPALWCEAHHCLAHVDLVCEHVEDNDA